jgi:hypothetical protein
MYHVGTELARNTVAIKVRNQVSLRNKKQLYQRSRRHAVAHMAHNMSTTKLQKIFIWDPCHPKAIKDVDTARDINFTVCAAFSG